MEQELKQKQIEELTALIDSFNIRTIKQAEYVAEYIVDKLNYRKIPENAVVLTNENEIKQYEWSKMLDKMGVFKFADKVRKETAEKFAERFKKKISSMIIELKANWATKKVEGFEKDVHELTCNCILNTLYTIKDFTVYEICKEITEGKENAKNE